MDLSKLTYSKIAPELIPLNSVNNHTIKGKYEDENLEDLDVSHEYQKKDGNLSTDLVFVISGGEKREKDFLRKLINQNDFHSMRVAFITEENQGLQPCQMQEKLNEIQKQKKVKIRGQVYRLEVSDKVFLLSDVDEFYDQLEKIFEENSTTEQVQWIVSNPCFEIWLYYCYRNDIKDLMCLACESVSKRSKKLKRIASELVSGGLNSCTAFNNMLDGIRNSSEHYSLDQKGIPVLFATQMHIMAQYLVDTLNRTNEYEMYLKRNIEQQSLKRKLSL